MGCIFVMQEGPQLSSLLNGAQKSNQSYLLSVLYSQDLNIEYRSTIRRASMCN